MLDQRDVQPSAQRPRRDRFEFDMRAAFGSGLLNQAQPSAHAVHMRVNGDRGHFEAEQKHDVCSFWSDSWKLREPVARVVNTHASQRLQRVISVQIFDLSKRSENGFGLLIGQSCLADFARELRLRQRGDCAPGWVF